jgi:hypothetical protein
MELKEGIKYCPNCGTSQKESTKEINSNQVSLVKVTVDDGKKSLKQLFSKSPVLAISEASKSKSYIWAVSFLVNILLFAFVSCNNITQLMNHAGAGIHDTLASKANASLGLGGVLPIGNAIPDFKIPTLYELFWPLILMAVIMLAMEFAGLYLPLLIRKTKPNSPLYVLNVVAVASLPLTASLIVNFVVGLLFPPATICIFAVAIIINMVLLYEGIHKLAEFETAPIWEFSLSVLVICIVCLIVSEMFVGNAMNQLINQIVAQIGSAAGSALGKLFG